MKYVDTAFAQLEFSIKLMQAAEDGGVKTEQFDTPLTIKNGRSILVLRDRIFDNHDDFINACQNLVSVCYGAAAIALNRAREEVCPDVPNPITSETDQWMALVYQIRNAFAHDIAEP